MTELIDPDLAGIARAAALLRDGQLVAFGTETVYGLGGRADRADTVAAIYAAKNRPPGNPLICHYPDATAAGVDALLNDAGQALAAAFWPGPLTLVALRRTGHLAANVGPAATLALRVPAHPVAQALLRATGVAIAAPSANRSGRVSPTHPDHVLAELGGRIEAVLNCGPCAVGLESTIVDISGAAPALLRPGAIPRDRIAAIAGPLAPPGCTAGRAPGQLPSHYAPSAPLRLAAHDCAPDEALLAFGPPIGHPGALFQLSAAENLQEAAHNLFAGLRTLDQAVAAHGLRGIAAMKLPTHGMGEALNDRLRRAATR